MSDEVRTLLAAAEGAEERRRRYSRVAELLDKLFFTLLVAAAFVLAAGVVTYLLYSHRLLASIGVALSISMYVALILRDIYRYKAAKAARQACELRCIIAEKLLKKEETIS